MLVVAPYYNRPTQEGLFRHFAQVAEATDRPVILYSIPSRCGVEIGVRVVERLRARYPHVRYIKESGGTVDRVDQLKQALGHDLVVLCGDDSLTLPFMAVGAEGVISVASNLLPREVVAAHPSRAGRRLPRRGPAAPPALSPVQGLVHRDESGAHQGGAGRAGRIRSPEVRLPLCELARPNLAALKRVLASTRR